MAQWNELMEGAIRTTNVARNLVRECRVRADPDKAQTLDDWLREFDHYAHEIRILDHEYRQGGASPEAPPAGEGLVINLKANLDHSRNCMESFRSGTLSPDVDEVLSYFRQNLRDIIALHTHASGDAAPDMAEYEGPGTHGAGEPPPR